MLKFGYTWTLKANHNKSFLKLALIKFTRTQNGITTRRTAN
jgi:hypothetical protein